MYYGTTRLHTEINKYDLFHNPALDNIVILNPNEMVGIPLEVFIHAKKCTP
jgi:hypothetical protein